MLAAASRRGSRSRRCAGGSGSAGTPATGGCGAGGRKASPGSSSGRGRRGPTRRPWRRSCSRPASTLRRQHPTWGPVKVKAALERRQPRSARGRRRARSARASTREGLTARRRTPAADAARRAAVRRRRGRTTSGRSTSRAGSAPATAPACDTLTLSRREQPVSAALPGGDASRRRACLADPRRRLPRAWPAAEAALRQRTALRDDGRGRALAALGQRDQGRRHPRAHHPGQAAGERPA